MLKQQIKKFPRLFALLRATKLTWIYFRHTLPPVECTPCFPGVSPCAPEQVTQLIEYLDSQDSTFFVQIGANDGQQGDPIFAYASKSPRWTGILVEPVSFVHARLRENYQNREGLIFEKSLISASAGSMTFYYVPPEAKVAMPELPYWYDQLGGFSQDHIVESLGPKIIPYIRSEEIPAISLMQLLERHKVTTIDFLNTDTEGHDWAIIQQLDLTRYRPRVMLVEYKHLTYWQMIAMLQKLSPYYHLAYTVDDLVAVDRTQPDLLAALQAKPASA